MTFCRLVVRTKNPGPLGVRAGGPSHHADECWGVAAAVRYIWSADVAATPSSAATASIACWATLRSTRPSELKYGPM